MNMEQKVVIIAIVLIAMKLGLQMMLRKGALKEQTSVLVETLDWVNTGLSALWIAFLIMYFIFQAFKIPSGSMKNTLLIKDHLFVNKFVYGVRLPVPSVDVVKNGFALKIGEHKYFSLKMKRYFKTREPKRGEIVVFAYPNNTSQDFVKRCIGLPGDKIEIINKVLYVNGQEQNEPYVIHLDPRNYTKDIPFLPDGLDHRDNFGPIIVPQDSYFVMGDNRDQSYDSRFWGMLQKDYLKGKAVFVFWPFKRMGTIK